MSNHGTPETPGIPEIEGEQAADMPTPPSSRHVMSLDADPANADWIKPHGPPVSPISPVTPTEDT